MAIKRKTLARSMVAAVCAFVLSSGALGADGTVAATKESEDDIPEDSVADEYDAFKRIVKLQGCKLDADTAWRWLTLAMKLRPNPNASSSSVRNMLETRSAVVELAALALIYTGQKDVLREDLKPLINDLEGFNSLIREPCSECGGDFSYEWGEYFGSHRKGKGKIAETCSSCKGTGKCTSNGCKNGEVEIVVRRTNSSTPGSGGVVGHRYRKCESCKGTGCCRYCGGTGSLERTCPKCGGKGSRISKDHIAHVYGVKLIHATDSLNMSDEKAQKAQDKQELKRLQEEAERRKIDPRNIAETTHDANKYEWAKEDVAILRKMIQQKKENDCRLRRHIRRSQKKYSRSKTAGGLLSGRRCCSTR